MSTTNPIRLMLGVLLLGAPTSSALLLACGDDPVVQADGLDLLSPREQLIRLSVDLRGVHPTEAELLAIEESPRLYAWYLDAWLDDPRFVDRVLEIWNGRFLTLNGSTFDLEFEGQNADGSAVSDLQLAASLGGEPLALLRSILEQGQPYSQIVLADHTMADPLLADVYALDRDDGDGWTPARYTDDRPHAGVLTMNGTWLRYPSMGGNANRHRANAISKLLMCDDYLTRPIVLNRSAVDELTIDPETAISTNEACQSCHSTLDPLAAHLFGFFEAEDEQLGLVYRPENEQGWREHSGKSPAFYGVPTANIREMAEAMADDGRFLDCAVRTAWEGLMQREVVDADWSSLQQHRQAFTDHDQSIRELVRSIALSREYLAAGTSDPLDGERVVGVRTASPAQLAGIIEGITGYRWSFDGADGLTTSVVGLPVLLGGIDAMDVYDRAYEPGVGAVLALERLAWSAAWDVASHDLDVDRQGDARMLQFVTVADTPESAPDAFDAQIRSLYLAATGLPLADDATEPAELAVLWKQVLSVEADPVKAWAAVLSAILRDPRVLTY